VTPARSLRDRLRSGVLLSLTGTAFNSGSTLIVNVVVANALGQMSFGEFTLLQSTILTVSSVAQLATGYTATKYVAEYRSTEPRRAGRVLGLCSAVALAMAFVAALFLAGASGWMAPTVLHAPQLTADLVLAGFVVFFTLLNGYLTGALAGLEAFREIAISGAIAGTGYLVICTTGVLVWGLHGTVVGLLMSAVLQWFILRGRLSREASRQGIEITRRDAWSERRIISGFALPAAISGLTYLPSFWIAIAFLARQPGGLGQVALFGAANNLRVLVLFLPNIVNGVGTSILNHQKGLGDEASFRRVYWANLAVTFGLATSGALVVGLAAPFVLRVFGRTFVPGYPVLLVLMLSTLFEGLAAAGYQVIQARAHMWGAFFLVVLPRDLTMLCVSLFLEPRLGAMGFAIGYTSAWAVALAGILLFVWRLGIRLGAPLDEMSALGPRGA
jgi:O-antigen/teichoic acid export membrane protein